MQVTGPFHVVGVSHRQASLQLRERLTLTPEQLRVRLGAEADPRSRIVVATCNRFEIYWWGDHDWEPWLHALADDVGASLPRGAILRHHGAAAARHLFEVTAGLASQIVGETEILGQVRRAWDLARTLGTSHAELDAVFGAALAAGRRIRRRTFLGRHPRSVGAAAVEAAKTTLGSLADARVVILGAGETATSLDAPLAEAGATRIRVAARRPERARAAFTSTSPEIVPWADLAATLTDADVLFGAIAAPRSIVAAECLSAAREGAIRPLLILDLGVPRNVSPDAASLPGVQLLDLDDLRDRHCPEAAVGSAAMREAEAMLDAELARLPRTLRGVQAAPELAALHQLGAALVEEEVAEATRRLGPTPERELAEIRRLAERLVRRLLYPASRRLRDAG